jgi:4-deoxy-L-threo-5-hexosulose-uronate ketol-isomerase
MKLLYTPHPADVQRMTTHDLREQFLLSELFVPGEIRLVHSGLDRLIVGGIMPGTEIPLTSCDELRARFFHERRESGIINIGDPGAVVVDGQELPVDRMECVYIGQGAESVSFRSCAGGRSAFYLLSCPAHRSYPTRKAGLEDAEVSQVGAAGNASCRRIHRYIHQHGIESCQLVMGFTGLSPGSVWNTWPPHTHERRAEIYLYLDLGRNLVMHFMGEPENSRHLVVRDREAVLSPPWSIHCGAGTGSYSFIWGMAGENQSFEDMDATNLQTLK